MVSLCEQLSKLGIWTRLHYVYPYPHVDDVIPLMAEGKILPYLDIPLQHASPRILKLMKRPGSVDRQLARIKQWREICGTDPTLNLYCRLPWRDGRRFPDATRLPERSTSGSRWLL